MDRLKKEAQNCGLDKSAPEAIQGHVAAIRDARKNCLSGLGHARESVNRTIAEAEQWVATNFGQLERQADERAADFGRERFPAVDLDFGQPTAELNTTVVRLVQAVAGHRQRTDEAKANSERATTAVKEEERLALRALSAI